ncbi:MAG TPA: class I SAM-dependent methyltransferase [Actinomycetota bacterium]|nr:class I SAM-dependent methyltransferase [Actinomycetota bacterium]
MTGWTRGNLRHAIGMIRYGPNPAATVYESIGEDFFLSLAPGWLNLGLWEGDGSDPAEAPRAVRRLVEELAADLPAGGDVLDVGNGLGAQEPVIAAVARPRRLYAVNITRSQLVAGRELLREAGAIPVNADATRLPLAPACVDGLICVEAAFHFASRSRFFAEAYRVLRPGGVLTMSDVPVWRDPRGPRELLAGLSLLRVWGLRRDAAATAEDIAAAARAAGFVDVRAELVGQRVIGPALRFVHDRLRRCRSELPRSYGLAVAFMVAQVDLLWERRMVDYLLLRARRPAPGPE